MGGTGAGWDRIVGWSPARTCSPATAHDPMGESARVSRTAPFKIGTRRQDMINPQDLRRSSYSSQWSSPELLFIDEHNLRPTLLHCKRGPRQCNAFPGFRRRKPVPKLCPRDTSREMRALRLNSNDRNAGAQRDDLAVGSSAVFLSVLPSSLSGATLRMIWKPKVSFLTPWNGSQ